MDANLPYIVVFWSAHDLVVIRQPVQGRGRVGEGFWVLDMQLVHFVRQVVKGGNQAFGNIRCDVEFRSRRRVFHIDVAQPLNR